MEIKKFRNDLTGKKIGRLTVIKVVSIDTKYRKYWLCKCDCGNETVVRGDCLTTRNTKACGCLKKELSVQRFMRVITKHGFHGERLYEIWQHMKDRCKAEGKARGKNYADKGVCVCSEWMDYLKFRDWALKNGYQNDLTIDRKDPFGNYEPQNCRWVTIKEQQRNKRNSIFIEFNGQKRHLKEWAEVLGIKYHTLFQRYEINKDPEFVLRPYKHGGKKI